jgi:hypothetical protein
MSPRFIGIIGDPVTQVGSGMGPVGIAEKFSSAGFSS